MAHCTWSSNHNCLLTARTLPWDGILSWNIGTAKSFFLQSFRASSLELSLPKVIWLTLTWFEVIGLPGSLLIVAGIRVAKLEVDCPSCVQLKLSLFADTFLSVLLLKAPWLVLSLLEDAWVVCLKPSLGAINGLPTENFWFSFAWFQGVAFQGT